MKYLNRDQLQNEINLLSEANTPFLFLIDFKGEKGIVARLSHLAKMGISCSINGIELGKQLESINKTINIESKPMPFIQYKKGFDKVLKHIRHGDTYLLNLTYPTQLCGDLDMNAIYCSAQARYKFMLPENFLFYSPEPFLQIEDDAIYSYPMKGTISGKEENAREKLLGNKKELYEHYTIVDLIRNDLSMISSNVEVESFRYIETIHTPKGEIFQTSTKIRGKLAPNWNHQLGDILLTVIPAGSISGAPKAKSVQIIEETEQSPRGFYTGIMGIYTDKKVDSCVIIRYLEKTQENTFYYRSGGGITALSDAEEEYQELLTKIYVPTS